LPPVDWLPSRKPPKEEVRFFIGSVRAGVDPTEISVRKFFTELPKGSTPSLGDIIIWRSDKEITTATLMMHAGVYADNGIVFSKLGWGGKYESLPIDDLLLNRYGEKSIWIPK